MRGVAVKCIDIAQNPDCEGSVLGSTPATVKLKGIDGGPHKRRNMWFNSMIREEPYPGSNGGRGRQRRRRPYGRPPRCCMVVVSSCREVSD